MNLHALDIPDDPAQLPGWLEGHITGLDLAQLVAELVAVHGDNEPSIPDLNRLLGTQKQSVLDQGLGALSPEALRQLLDHPRLLLDLQELVLCDGGPFWNTITPDAEHVALIQRGAEKLDSMVRGQATPARLSVRPPPRWYQRSWVASLATAAALLIAFVGYEQFVRRPIQPASTAWGWNKSDAAPADASASTYLNHLADQAGEWFQERPTNAGELAARIQEFRGGCSHLIFAEHRPLAALDRQWLVENCRTWGRKLDKQLAALESGQNPTEVREESDLLIRRIIDELRERAKQAG